MESGKDCIAHSIAIDEIKRRMVEGEARLMMIPQIADTVSKIHLAVCGRNEIGMPGLIQKHDSNVTQLNAHAQRITTIERERDIEKGINARMASIYGACAGIAGSLVIALIGKFFK